ncbi:hypothetical protein NHU_04160 [Rhodovulum sulfidophilum]|uniref:Mobilization protein n=1 Tax=Rhodovulum sulfidophilum TaxID=35806 RepID=A0A0D6B919_RHOSU|nr:hypothetical protein NHU_04160 [Rhodovulum sulfidophilum]
MAERRDILVKVRLSTAEAAEIDDRMCERGVRSRAVFLRQCGLGPGGDDEDVARLIGRIGLTLNMLVDVPGDRLDHLGADLRRLSKLLSSRWDS